MLVPSVEKTIEFLESLEETNGEAITKAASSFELPEEADDLYRLALVVAAGVFFARPVEVLQSMVANRPLPWAKYDGITVQFWTAPSPIKSSKPLPELSYKLRKWAQELIEEHRPKKNEALYRTRAKTMRLRHDGWKTINRVMGKGSLNSYDAKVATTAATLILSIKR